jgi:hypothetical protein
MALHNQRVFIEQGIEIPLLKQIDIKATIRYSYESVRLKTLKAFDLFMVLGIAVKTFKQ